MSGGTQAARSGLAETVEPLSGFQRGPVLHFKTLAGCRAAGGRTRRSCALGGPPGRASSAEFAGIVRGQSAGEYESEFEQVVARPSTC